MHKQKEKQLLDWFMLASFINYIAGKHIHVPRKEQFKLHPYDTMKLFLP